MPSSLPTFLDAAASTPMDPQVLEQMLACMNEPQAAANPSSSHRLGRAAMDRVIEAEHTLQRALHAVNHEVVWTSGATEALNLGVQGVLQAYGPRRGWHLVTTQAEHAAVLATCEALERQHTEVEVTYLPVDAMGQIDPNTFEAALRPDTVLAVFHHVNNETGAIQPLSTLAKLAQRHGVMTLVDAAQSLGKVSLNLSMLPVDFFALSGHKAHGPKGVGALLVPTRPRRQITPLFWGGGQQRGRRPGTLPTPLLVGMAAAVEAATACQSAWHRRASTYRDHVWHALANLPGVQRHGGPLDAPERQSPCVLNVGCPTIDVETLLWRLQDTVALGTGSACHSTNVAPSHVLTAMGVDPDLAARSIRISFHRDLTWEDVQHATRELRACAKTLMDGAPTDHAA